MKRRLTPIVPTLAVLGLIVSLSPGRVLADTKEGDDYAHCLGACEGDCDSQGCGMGGHDACHETCRENCHYQVYGSY
jgi:hypothetical protein